MNRKWSMFPPVLIVLLLSLPIALFTQWEDFEYTRELAQDTVKTSGTFTGISDDRANTITIIPGAVVENTIPDYTENVTLTNSTGGTEERTQTTGGGTVIEGLLNAALMVGIAIGFAFLIFFLFKLKKRITLKLFFAVALGLCTTLAIILYGYFFTLFLEAGPGIEVQMGALYLVILVLLGITGGVSIVYNMVWNSTNPRKKNPALIAFCVILGPFLAIVLPVYVVVFLLMGVALWDLYAAKRGIIKEMINLSDEHRKEERAVERKRVKDQRIAPPVEKKERRPLIRVDQGEDITSYGLYEGKHYSLGIGDFIFFSIMVSTTFTWFMMKMPWMGFYVPALGEVLIVFLTLIIMAVILLGLKQTLVFVDKESIMPGLPLSVLWGLLSFLAIVLVLQGVDYIFFGELVNPF